MGSQMSDERSKVAVGQFLVSSFMPLLADLDKGDEVIRRLAAIQEGGNDLGVAMGELVQHAVFSAAGQEPPLVQRDLSDAEILRYWSATQMLIPLLVAMVPPEELETVTAQLSGYAEANVQGTGPMYVEALDMVREVAIVARAAAAANQAFGI